MTDKKDPGKFTIRFNICDPQHKAVIDLLNRQGRSKAQFLVSAVLHYINCKETPEVSVPVPNQAALEEMILAILAKNQSYLKKQPEPKPSTAQQDAAISAAWRTKSSAFSYFNSSLLLENGGRQFALKQNLKPLDSPLYKFKFY